MAPIIRMKDAKLKYLLFIKSYEEEQAQIAVFKQN